MKCAGELEVVLDRRLQQDDNRGLGQGVTDNKLTASLYHVLLEDRMGEDKVRGGAPEQLFSVCVCHCPHLVFPSQEVGKASVDHLSLLAHLTSLSVCHPPITMVAQRDAELPKLRPFMPLSASLPCDLHLLNLKTLEDPKVRALLHHLRPHDGLLNVCSTGSRTSVTGSGPPPPQEGL